MIICRIIATKRIIEMQSNATLGLLTQNALVAFGLSPEEVEEIEVDQAGYEAALAEDPIVIAHEQAENDEQDKANRVLQEVLDKLPSWNAVDTAVTNIANLTDAKVFIRKLARVVYLLAKNEET